jgi:uncharacterized protein YjiS (DUF1127 family)
MATQFLSAFGTFGTRAWRGVSARAAAMVALRTVQTRAELAELSPRLLADIGLSPADARAEHARAPWDLGPSDIGPRDAGPWNLGRTSPGRNRQRRTFPAPMTGVAAQLQEAWRRHRTRRLLAELDSASLRDIGVSRAQAEREANKPFWRA